MISCPFFLEKIEQQEVLKERQLRWAQDQNLDGTNPLGSSQHGIKDETFAYVENEATIEASFSSADASVSTPKSNKKTKK